MQKHRKNIYIKFDEELNVLNFRKTFNKYKTFIYNN